MPNASAPSANPIARRLIRRSRRRGRNCRCRSRRCASNRRTGGCAGRRPRDRRGRPGRPGSRCRRCRRPSRCARACRPASRSDSRRRSGSRRTRRPPDRSASRARSRCRARRRRRIRWWCRRRCRRRNHRPGPRQVATHWWRVRSQVGVGAAQSSLVTHSTQAPLVGSQTLPPAHAASTEQATQRPVVRSQRGVRPAQRVVAAAARGRERVRRGIASAAVSSIAAAPAVDRARASADVAADRVTVRGRAAAAAGDETDRTSDNHPSRSRTAHSQSSPPPSKRPETDSVLICARDGGIWREAVLATFRIDPASARVLTAASYVVLCSDRERTAVGRQ